MDGPTQRVALMNQKGGVGKTTTAVNLAAAIANRGKPTMLVDLDPQAHATLHLGVDPASLARSVYDALLEPEAAGQAAMQVRQNLWLLPSEVNLAGAEIELAGVAGRTRRLAQALAELGDVFEVVLIDCPPSLGLLTLNALAAAERVLAPMQAHFLALQGLGKLFETVQMMAEQADTPMRVLGAVLCMHDENTNLAREVVADLEGFFEDARGSDAPWAGGRVLRPAVRRNIKLAEAPSFGQTIFEYAPTSAGAADYHALGGALLTALEKRSEEASAPAQAPKIVVPTPAGSAAAAAATGAGAATGGAPARDGQSAGGSSG